MIHPTVIDEGIVSDNPNCQRVRWRRCVVVWPRDETAGQFVIVVSFMRRVLAMIGGFATILGGLLTAYAGLCRWRFDLRQIKIYATNATHPRKSLTCLI